MAENQWYPALSGVVTTGVELQLDDVVGIAKVAGLADDRVLAEFLRLPYFGQSGAGPYTPAKAIIPTSYLPNLTGVSSPPLPPHLGTVQPTGAALATINVAPFRAIVGSRTTVAQDPLACWHDIRSGIFAPPSLLRTLTLNPSVANPRWDLVYASMFVDTNSPPAGSRRVKDTNSQTLSALSLTMNLVQTVNVVVLQGTESATPAVPALPADTATAYNIPLALIRIPAGFGAASTVAQADIRDLAPTMPVSPVMGVSNLRPASGNNDNGAPNTLTGYQQFFPWTAVAAQRPSVFLPPTMVGGESRIFQVDLNSAAAPSLVSGGIVDSSIDWRYRFVKVLASLGNSGMTRLATDNNNPAGLAVPSSLTGIGNPSMAQQLQNTFPPADATMVGGSMAVCYLTNTVPGCGAMTGAVGLYVLLTDGVLRFFFSGAPAMKFFFWIEASAQYPNF